MNHLFHWSHQLGWREFWQGLAYSVPFLGILTVHEFGHFFMAKRYKIKVTLPYYLPIWLGFIGTSFGTMGAVIRLLTRPRTAKEYFDVGIAGPFAGLVVALGVLFYAFTHLPPPEYIFQIHPEYQKYGLDYANYVYSSYYDEKVALGENLMWLFFKNFVASSPEAVPNMYEMIHYPYLFAGYLALLFTALNLLPVGQLDGGHILYGLLGSKYHALIARILFTGFVFYAGLGLISPYPEPNEFIPLYIKLPLYCIALYMMFLKMWHHNIRLTIIWSLGILALQILLVLVFPSLKGYSGWLFFAFMVGRLLGIDHPQVREEGSLGITRKILGWLALLIFILCFTPTPLVIK